MENVFYFDFSKAVRENKRNMPTSHITTSHKMAFTSDTKDELLAFIDISGAVVGETAVVKSTISVLHIRYRQNVRVIDTVTTNLIISI